MVEQLWHLRPRDLIGQFMPGATLDQDNVAHAIRLAGEEGWLANRHPLPGRHRRSLVLIRRDGPLAPVFRFIRMQPATVPRGLVEACLGRLLDDFRAGKVLGRYGLAIRFADPSEARLIPTSPRLARLMDVLRYWCGTRRMGVGTVLQAVLDRDRRPAHVPAAVLEQTARWLRTQSIRADGLSSGADHVLMSSLWHLTACYEPPPF